MPFKDPETITIALLQMEGKPLDVDANRTKAEAFCRRAAVLGADIAVFPEIFSVGSLEITQDQTEEMTRWRSLAIPADGPWPSHFAGLARDLDMAILCTYLEAKDDVVRNSATLIDRHGIPLFTYAKVHMMNTMICEATCEKGNDFLAGELDTRQGPVNVGSMICMDMLFPESARSLMVKGAELILVPAAVRVEQIHLQMIASRAYENAVTVAMTNYPMSADFNGQSTAYSPSGPFCETLVIGGYREDIFLARLHLPTLRTHRSQTVCCQAYRRPQCYSVLLDTVTF